MDPEQWQAFIASLPAAARARMAANIVANQQAPAPAVAAETARTAGPSPVRSIGEMIAKSAGDAFTLPGRALYGEIPRADEMPQSEAVGEALNFAGMVSTPALRGARAPNTVSMSGASDGPGIKAYHGTPHDFDKFSMDKLGTGEGVQAFGHGLYFAENEGVARSYRDYLSRKISVDGQPLVANNAIVGTTGNTSVDEILTAFKGDVDAALAHVKTRGADLTPAQARRGGYEDQIKALERLRGKVSTNIDGHMYEVNIKATPDDFLDWDKPLSEQSEKIRNALPEMKPEWTGAQIYESSRLVPGDFADKAAAAKALRDRGILGTRFLDQDSRSVGEGTRNLAVFDDSIIEILRKYGLLGPLGLGAGAAAVGTNDGT